MSARYRIEACRCGGWLHFSIIEPNGRETSAATLPRAMERIAEIEAYRFAGLEWSIGYGDRGIVIRREGEFVTRTFRTWGEVASFLKSVRDAGRKPLAVA